MLLLLLNLRENLCIDYFYMNLDNLTYSSMQSFCSSEVSSGCIWISEVLEGAVVEVKSGVLERREEW